MMRRLAFSLLLGLLAVPLVGQASRDFDGAASNQINCADEGTLEGIDALTVGAWYRLHDDDATASVIFGKGSGGLSVFLLRKTGTEQHQFSIRDAGAVRTATSTATFTAGTWQCSVGVYNRADSETLRLRLYMNGALDGTAAGSDAAIQGSTAVVYVNLGTITHDGEIAHVFAEPRAWTAAEAAEYCRGNLIGAQAAAGRGGGYLPLWDNAADPGTYMAQGLFTGDCSATSDPAASGVGPPVFIPGGGND